MSVPTTTTRKQYVVSSSSLATYAYDFLVYSTSDVDVYTAVTATATPRVVSAASYSVTDTGQIGGGNVVFSATKATSVGAYITIVRNVALTQDDDYVENAPFRANTLEKTVDKIVMMVQQLNTDMEGSLKRAVTAEATNTLYLPTPQTGYVLGWNGTTVVNYAAPSGTLPTGTAGRVVLASETTSTIQSGLKMSSFTKEIIEFDTATDWRTKIDAPSESDFQMTLRKSFLL